MTVTLADAIRRIRSLLNEPTYPTLPGTPPANGYYSGFYSDTELTDWINDGLRDISRRAEDLITFDTSVAIPAYVPSTVNNGVPTYNLPDDTIRIQRIEFVPILQTNQIYKLEPSTQNEMDQIWGTYQQNSSTYPRWWVTRGYPGGSGRNNFTIQIYPQSSQAGTLNIFYYRLPIRINDPLADPSQYNVTLDIIAGWEDMVLDYAVYHALQKGRNPEWQNRKSEYEEKVSQMIDVTRKFHDQQSYVSYGTNYLPGWLTGTSDW